jgi:hypothetical protein
MDENQMIRGVSTGFACSRKLTPFFAAPVFVGLAATSEAGARRPDAKWITSNTQLFASGATKEGHLESFTSSVCSAVSPF